MNTNSISVVADGAVEDIARQTVASLPRSFSMGGAPGFAALAVIDGAADWTRRAVELEADGVTEIVVIDPGPVDPDDVRRLAESSLRVHLSERYAGDPALAALGSKAGARLQSPHLFAAFAVTHDAAETNLFDQIRLARAFGISGIEVTDVQATQDTCLVTARGSSPADTFLRLQCARTTAGPARHTVRAFSGIAVTEATLFGASSARPAEITILDESGHQRLPDIFENAHRAALRNLEESEEHDLRARLRELADDITVARSAHP